jgi:hypothetical protein
VTALTPKIVMTHGSTTLTGVSVSNLDTILFPGDKISFGADGASHTNAHQLFEIASVSSTGAVLTGNFDGTSSSAAGVTVYRHYAGRGDVADSKVHCVYDAVICDNNRVQTSGSVQSKLEDLVDLVDAGVRVDRDGPDANGGFIWRVTFLDNAPSGSSDYVVAVNTDSLSSSTGGTPSVTIAGSPLVDGVTYTQCSGTLQVPSAGGLTQGADYFARVTAVNSEGYSLPQAVASPVAPTVVPGAPTGVTLEVTSATELRVLFSAPSDSGGDAITQYKIEYDTASDFSTASTELLTYLSGGAPFFKQLTGLTTGTPYFVRVSAMNSNGYGPTQATTPSSLNPHQTPSAPTSVMLSVTSDSMLTTSFAAPTSDGGDAVSQYRIEWDTAVGFNSGSLAPHKGTVDVDASTHNSYTIELLSSSTTYYVRVAAINSAGAGSYQTSTPVSTMPSLMVPGTPHTLAAVSGANAGEVDITWQRPRVPHHGFPCSGTTTFPVDCPTPYGGSASASDGGSSITEYEVEWNERSDFTGSDGSKTTTTGLSITLTGLIEGRAYYVRVLARNNLGSGSFCELSGTDICDGSLVTAMATL